MAMNKEVLITSPSREDGAHLKSMLDQLPGLEVRTHIVSETHPEVIGALVEMPGLLVLDIGNQDEEVLREWALRPVQQRPPMIVVGPANDNHLMRWAMQAGARDYFARPVMAAELAAAVSRIVGEMAVAEAPKHDGQLIAVINAKGGSGASFIACSLAHLLAAYLERKTALIDLDLQFGALPLSLDLKTRDTFFDVIGAAEQLDRVALESYMTKHESGLHVLGTMSEQLAMPWEVSTTSMQRLLEVALQTYRHVVVDLPRQIDPLTSTVLSSADKILVVMQQSFAHLRDTKRMFSLLRGYLGIPSDRIVLLINRFHEKNPISEDDIREAIKPAELMLLPNDFGHVTEALNLGIPLYEGARNAPITKALSGLAARLDGPARGVEVDIHPGKSSLRRVLGMQGSR